MIKNSKNSFAVLHKFHIDKETVPHWSFTGCNRSLSMAGRQVSALPISCVWATQLVSDQHKNHTLERAKTKN